MTTVATLEPSTTGTNIVALVEATPLLVLNDSEKFIQFYEAMKREADALDADVSTERGRKAIASMAYKVARTKTAIDDAGKKLNEEARAKINAVDESRRTIREQLDALKAEVRKPLTDWETAEAEREEKAASELEEIRTLAKIDFDATADAVRASLADLMAITIDPEVHAGATQIATNLRVQAIETLEAAIVRLDREETERAELEKLRAENEARAVAEAERAAAAEAERIAEQKRRDEADAEKARADAIAKEAGERARLVALEAAAEAERVHAEALAAERRKTEEAERAMQAERDRAAKAEADRKAEAERVAKEQAAREADRAHRSKILAAAKEAVMEAGPVDEATAKAIVLAIAAGNVPNTTIQF